MENAELCLKNKFKVGDRVTRVKSLLDSCEQEVWIDWDLTSKWTWSVTTLIPAKNFKKRRIKNHSIKI